MNAKITLLPFIFLAFIILAGCETKVDDDWSGFGSTAHFPPPHEGDHVGYLMANAYPLSSCQECHGADYDGGSSGISCVECHQNSAAFVTKCNRCHGNADGDPSVPVDQAPPNDVSGNASTELVTVGAHTTHLTGGEYTDGVSCNDCHNVPSAWDSQGHIDFSPAEVVFSGISAKKGANPIWEREEAECSNTYCHGESEPEWTAVGGDEAACGTCHSLPPPAPHYLATTEQCVWCHSSVIDAQGEIINKALHVNGFVNQ